MEQLELFEKAPGMTKSTLKAWVDHVLNNPVDQDQLDLALAVKDLLEETAQYQKVLGHLGAYWDKDWDTLGQEENK
jgi:hypothetical protein